MLASHDGSSESRDGSSSKYGDYSDESPRFHKDESPKFYSFKVDEDPQEFVDEIQKIVDIMDVTPMEKAELGLINFKGISQVWFNQWKEERVNMGPTD